MPAITESLINTGTQCWACPIFDSLFAIISNTAAAAYQRLTYISIMIFCVLFAFYLLNVVWQNIKKAEPDPFYQNSVKPVIIKSLMALALLSAGLFVPRFISTITFEPVAQITLKYTESMLPPDYVMQNDYTPIKLADDGFFNSKLRDTILQIMQTSVSNFQTYIKFGIAVIDEAFSKEALLGIGPLIRHIIICFIGIYLTYNFTRLFIEYSFCFMDIIVAMALFAFFFPFSIVFFIFKDAAEAPDWMKKLGGNLGGGQIKKLINAIVSVGATILTYTIIMEIIHGFLLVNNIDTNTIQNSAKSILDFDLENSSAAQITFAGSIVLVYILKDIANQIPEITKKILAAFDVSEENKLSTQMGQNAWKMTNIAIDQAKNLAKTIIKPEASGTK